MTVLRYSQRHSTVLITSLHDRGGHHLCFNDVTVARAQYTNSSERKWTQSSILEVKIACLVKFISLMAYQSLFGSIKTHYTTTCVRMRGRGSKMIRHVERILIINRLTRTYKFIFMFSYSELNFENVKHCYVFKNTFYFVSKL